MVVVEVVLLEEAWGIFMTTELTEEEEEEVELVSKASFDLFTFFYICPHKFSYQGFKLLNPNHSQD